ncbi:hypothetical protein CA13_07930 [Planctomycetes bacterium CA13]|uniref:Uncharacterized protein n=1 Tax=Novipirellula herctigrandis TaxID=2527986 RepID=A0A5C5YY29_9BACT|nr:hypothetical protein CA13_07930 [Planctomycetes bacterium CA13]
MWRSERPSQIESLESKDCLSVFRAVCFGQGVWVRRFGPGVFGVKQQNSPILDGLPSRVQPASRVQLCHAFSLRHAMASAAI